MAPEVAAAWITGGCTLVVGLVRGVYKLRTARRGRANVSTATEPPPPVVIATPPPASPGPAPPVERPVERPEERPDQKILPLVEPAPDYKGLTGAELDARFLADMEFTVKPGDTFRFSDGSGDEE